MAGFEEIRKRMTEAHVEPKQQPDGVDGNMIERLGESVGANDATLHAYADLRSAFLEQPLIDEMAVTFNSEGPELIPSEPLAARSLIRGVGLGSGTDTTRSIPGEPVVRIYTDEVMSNEEAVSHAIGIYNIQSLRSEKAGVVAVPTGTIDAFAHRNRWRPTCPGGVSVGHFNITAGTLGAYCKGRAGERMERDLILSNNHVLADVNAATIGDDILQHGQSDGGTQPGDVIALLEDFVTISFTGPNLVDAATAWVDNSFVDRRFLYVSGGAQSFYNCSLPTAFAAIGMQVGKSGRTTGLTSGSVAAVGVTVEVNMGGGRIARFVDQIEIQGTRGIFSRPGDSGSLIWTWDQSRSPVGLLFAGGNLSTFVNPIETVLQALDIDLVV
ncbi:MAG: hypothetical protein ACPGJE_00230 [Wenzhouxiangellaceae bacterium]